MPALLFWFWVAVWFVSPAGRAAVLAEPAADPREAAALILAPFRDPAGDAALHFLEQRTAADPDDSSAQNRLAALCLRRLRATGDLDWLRRADQAARRSLASVPADRNRSGLMVNALVHQESHRFAEARDLARQLCEQQPDEPTGHQFLGDALLELGDLEGADHAYRDSQRLSGDENRPELAVRLARLGWLRGDDAAARAALAQALDAALALTPPAPEMVAYCHVQAGQLDFDTGEWPAAETHYRAAFAALPSSFVAVEHLAELAGARGDYDGAARLYEQVIARVPRPEFSHALADLYLFANQPEKARPWQERALAGYLESVNRGEAFYFHHLAAFYADTQSAPAEAVRWARRDLEGRRSGFAHEALGWALHRSGDFPAAAAEFDLALAPGTRSAHLLSHAGQTYFRAGEIAKGRDCLQRAYAVNPRADTFHVHR